MSSVNPFVTFHYSQPEEYRFSHDSVFLARRVFDLLGPRKLSGLRALDIGGGTGIVGMDFLFHRRSEGLDTPAQFDFFEIQDEYRPHFEENCQRLGPVNTELHFVPRNYADLLHPDFFQMYHLVVCNPPYFSADEGKLSPSRFKNRCRFFLDSDEDHLYRGIANCLHPEGEAFVLTKKPLLAKKFLRSEQIGDIRGTPLLHLKRISPLAE